MSQGNSFQSLALASQRRENEDQEPVTSRNGGRVSTEVSMVSQFAKWHGFVTVCLAYLQLGFERYFLQIQAVQIQVQTRLAPAPSLQRLETNPSRPNSLKTTRYFNFHLSSGKRRRCSVWPIFMGNSQLSSTLSTPNWIKYRFG